jgi:hypothetical protein
VAAHRYWRLNVTANGGAPLLTIHEIQFREVAGTPQLFSGGTASASSQNSATFAASKAADNSATTYWATANGSNTGWWKYDYGAGNDKDIVEITVYTSTDAFFNPYAPTVFTLEYSDDNSSWTAAASIAGITWSAGETKVFTLPLTPEVRVSQIVPEALRGGARPVALSQAVLEILRVAGTEVPLPPDDVTQPQIWIIT